MGRRKDNTYSTMDMEICNEVHVHDMDIAKEPMQSEESGDVFCDAGAAAAIEYLEDEEEEFEDAVDNLTFDSFKMADEHEIVGQSCDKHEVDTMPPPCKKLKDANDKLMNDVIEADAGAVTSGSYEDISDSRHSSFCDDKEDATEQQEAAIDTLIVDEEVLREREACLTDAEKQSRKEEAVRLKELGNKHFTSGCFEAAVLSYTDALATCLLCHSVDRAIIYSNRAAAKTKLGQHEDAIIDCTKALEFNPDYMKALLRRAELYEKTDKLDEALEDYSKALERDCSLHVARAACMRLPDQIKERNEKMKEEMIGKLKDLGNMILRPFGLSTNNFNLQQDPATGSYSVSFQQNPQPPS